MTWGRSCFAGSHSYLHSYPIQHTYSYNSHHFYSKNHYHSYGGYSHYGQSHCGDYHYGKNHSNGHHNGKHYGHQSHIIIQYKPHSNWTDWNIKGGCYIPKPPKSYCPPEPPISPKETEKPLPENGNQVLPPSYAGEDGENVNFINAFNEQTDINTYGPPVLDNIIRSLINGTEQNDTLTGNAFANHIVGNHGNDVIYGLESNDLLYGGKGDDHLEGGDGDDYLNGGQGNDTLIGGEGNDSYFITDHKDTVIELDHVDGGNDTIYTTIDYTTPHNVENLYLLGNDSIHATGNNLDNLLVGNAAHNTLNGLAGNDQLHGGEGSDTYIFNTGYGQDVIYEYDSSSNDLDSIHFGKNIKADDLELSRDGHNLVISVENSNDKLIVNDWFKHSGYQIEELVFTDSPVSFSADQINHAFSRYAANSNITIDLDNLTPQTLSIC